MASAPWLLCLLCTSALAGLPPAANQQTTDSPYHVVEDSATATTAQPEDEVTCGQVMANNGLNFSSFWHGAAHGIHSIYLEEIREFFEPDTPATNRIPVVNEDLSAEQTILFDAPLAGYDEDFKTMSLKVMAYFMLNDKPDFATQGINTLEKLTHQYHMHEIYAAAAPIYRNIKQNPPQDTELCPCINDVTGNGILTEMVNIARQLKYFGSKRKPRARGGNPRCQANTTSRKYVLWGCFSYITESVARRRRDADKEEVTSEEIGQSKQAYLANSTLENAENLLELKPWVPNTLEGPDQWISYEAMLTTSMLNQKELNDFAYFMYCKLNKPELDHPKDLFD